MSELIKSWYSPKPKLGLIPLGYLLQKLMSLRHWCYRVGIKKTTYFEIPIIVVGNLTVGGTGKTPVVAALALWLRSQGFNPGLISRGYGGTAAFYPQKVTLLSDPNEVGDEAVMLVQQTGCPIIVAPDRVAAVKALIAAEACDMIISDDGLQHLALGRDIEIVVIDEARKFGNGYCLPAGPLRESITRLAEADFCISMNKSFSKNEKKLNNCRSDFSIKKWSLNLAAGKIYNITDKNILLDLNSIKDCTVHAVAGIGNPQSFFDALKHLDISFTPHIFPDHHLFKFSDIDFEKDSIVIMTEKDAVKCRVFADQRHWCLPVQVQMDEGFVGAFQDKLQSVLKNKE